MFYFANLTGSRYTRHMSLVFIVNAKASRVQRKMHQLENSIASLFPTAKVLPLKKPTDLAKTIHHVMKEKPRTIVLVGGDGTVISGIDILKQKGYNGKIGIIPLGTANYLARNIGTPLDLDEALTRIKRGRTRDVRFGQANGTLFSLFAGIGFTTKISQHVSVTLKQKTGQLAYIVEGFRQFKDARHFTYDITTDGTRDTLHGKAHQILIANADLSHQLPVAPSTSISRASMMLTIYTSKSKIRLILSLLLYIFSLGRVKTNIQTYRITKARIKTSPMQKFSLDGEVFDAEPVDVTISEDAVKLII